VSKNFIIMLGTLALVLISILGGHWFGTPFRIALLVATLAAWYLVERYLKTIKSNLAEGLKDEPPEIQDEVLAQLDEADRKEMLRKLGREDR
jgi:hypothetical protein